MEAKNVRELIEAYSSVYQEKEEVSEDLQQKVGQALDAAAKNPVVQAIGKVIAPVGQGRKTPVKDGNWRPVVAKEETEEVDEAMSSYDRNRLRAAKRAEARNEARRRGQTGNVPGVGYVSPRPERTTWTDESGQQRHHTGARMPKKEDQKESFDLFDTILEYLVAEGYADTNKAALAIMANMSEEWKQSIVEEKRPFPFKRVEAQKERARRGSVYGRDTGNEPAPNVSDEEKKNTRRFSRMDQVSQTEKRKDQEAKKARRSSTFYKDTHPASAPQMKKAR